VGNPFRTRLADSKALVLLHQVPLPHFICKVCKVCKVVRQELGCELLKTREGVALLMLEIMRQIDMLHNWQQDTLQEYGPPLQFLQWFESHFSIQIFKPNKFANHPGLQQYPSCRVQNFTKNTEGKDGTFHCIGLGTVHQISHRHVLHT
jgi:hypothetical protein